MAASSGGPPHDPYLALAGIEHRRTRVRTPRTNGFAGRFYGTEQNEFVSVALRDKVYVSIDDLQDDFGA